MTKVAVKLAHHYTDPDTGKDYVPGDEIKVDEQTAKGLAAGGYVAGTADAAGIAPAKTTAPRRGRAKKTAAVKTTAAQSDVDAGGATT